MFMSLRELSIVIGFPLNKVCSIAKRPGFPLFEKKVLHADFMAWYRNQLPNAASTATAAAIGQEERFYKRPSRMAAQLARRGIKITRID